MGVGRRSVGLDDASAWVFNRMADVYDARPAYPLPLLDALEARIAGTGGVIADVGAGIGHLALPLAARGHEVHAIEPAMAMLDRLREEAARLCLRLHAHHAAGEAMPLPARSVDLVVIADALHFLDAEQTGLEVARVLRPGGSLALLTSRLGDSPYMRALVSLMEEAAPRRPRDTDGPRAQLVAVGDVEIDATLRFEDEVAVDPSTLLRILRSISFLGPAMNPTRWAAFVSRVLAIPEAPVWARRLELALGTKRIRRGRSRPSSSKGSAR